MSLDATPTSQPVPAALPADVRPADALRADHEALLAIVDRFGPEDWSAPSGCAGWTVKDLVTHLSTILWMVADASVLPDTGDLAPERAQDVIVASRADWSPERVVADYADVGPRAAEGLDFLAGQPELIVPMGALGTYPAPLLATSVPFDHYTHIRADLFAPRGPVGPPAPPADALRLAPAITWVLTALPQHSPAVLTALPGPVELTLSGLAGGTWMLAADGVRAAGDPGAGGAPVATVACSGHDLVLWATRRAGWDDLGVETGGDAGALATLRDGVHVF